MNTTTGSKNSNDAVASWEALLSAVGGSIVLWATWFFFNDRLRAPGTEWYAWIRPSLLVLGGILSLVAAVLLAARRPAGRGVLQLAVGTIPLVLAVGLVIVPFRFIGGLMRWFDDNAGGLSIDTLLDRVRISPLALVINLAIIAIIVVVALLTHLSKGEKSDGAPKATRDEG